MCGMARTLRKGGRDALIVDEENQVRIVKMGLESVDQPDCGDQFQWDNLRVPGSQSEKDLHRSVQ